MSKLTATASICQAVEFFGLKVKVGHDKHGFGKVIFADFGNQTFWAPPEEIETLWVCQPDTSTWNNIIAAIRPPKEGSVKKPADQSRRLVRQGTRLLKAAARLEGLLDADRGSISVV